MSLSGGLQTLTLALANGMRNLVCQAWVLTRMVVFISPFSWLGPELINCYPSVNIVLEVS